jgi:probable HAF family extracellular repeat protein
MNRLTFIASFLLAGASIATGQSYTVTDLGIPPQDTYSVGSALNDIGQVVGASGTSVQHGFFWSAGQGLSDLPPLHGGILSAASGINASGVVAGFSTTNGGGTDHAVLWIRGKVRDLGTLPGGSVSFASAINVSGEVAGGSNSATTDTHAILWSSAQGMRDLGTLSGGYSLGQGLNRFGHVVGQSTVLGNNSHGFFWTRAHGMQDLGTLPGGSSSDAYAINDLGQITGYSDCGSSCFLHAVLWIPGGGVQDLGSLPNSNESNGNSINNSSQVVGYAVLPGAVYHAFVWSEAAGMQDLNDLITANSGWTLEFAFAINDNGQITGRGSINGQDHAFLLMPVSALSSQNKH